MFFVQSHAVLIVLVCVSQQVSCTQLLYQFTKVCLHLLLSRVYTQEQSTSSSYPFVATGMARGHHRGSSDLASNRVNKRLR